MPEFNPTSSSVTNTQARQFAVESGTCIDGTECGSHPRRFGDDGFCAQCPNMPDETTRKQMIDRCNATLAFWPADVEAANQVMPVNHPWKWRQDSKGGVRLANLPRFEFVEKSDWRAGEDLTGPQSPNQLEEAAEWALLDKRLNGSRDAGDVFADEHSAPWFLERGLLHMSDRAARHDTPGGERSMGATVAAYKAVTGDDRLTTESQGWLFMVLLKLVRSQQGEFKADNFKDAAAYCGLMGEAAAEEYQDD